MDAAQLTRLDEVLDVLHAFGEPVTQIDPEKPVRAACRIDGAPTFVGISPEWLLAGDHYAALESATVCAE